MDGMFGWEGEDWIEEEEALVNQNDPFAAERDQFSPYERHLDEDYERYLDSEDEEQKAMQDALDDFSTKDAIITASILGGMLSEGEDPDQFDEQVERISMKEANAEPTKKGEKLPLRPFEKWVDDVLNGRKTWDDDL